MAQREAMEHGVKIEATSWIDIPQRFTCNISCVIHRQYFDSFGNLNVFYPKLICIY
jgi:hypothetical protein